MPFTDPQCSPYDMLVEAARTHRYVRFMCKQTGGASAVTLRPVLRQDGMLSFQQEEGQRGSCLRIKPRGQIDFQGFVNGPLTAFLHLKTDAEDAVLLLGGQSRLYLSIKETGFVAVAEPVPLLVEFAAPGERAAPQVTPMPKVDPSALSAEDVAHFKRHGYIILRAAVPPHLVRDSLRAINHQMGRDVGRKDEVGGHLTLDEKVRADPASIKATAAIFNESPKFWSAVNLLLGEGNVGQWGRQAGPQLALRFPQAAEEGVEVADRRPGTRYHIDGMNKDKLCPFTLLCGVALTDQSRPEMGNLHVFPGSHLHEGLRRYYSEKIADESQTEDDDSKPDLGASTQVLLQPGDVVLAHQLLGHRVGINTSEQIRYQLYYRIQRKNHETFKHRIIDDPWVEFAI